MLPNDAMKIRLAILPLSALLVSCATTEQSGFITVSSQPANVGDARIAAKRYHDSGGYDRDLRVVASQAASWIKTRAAGAHRPALLLDIDEPALSNWAITLPNAFGPPISAPHES